ncbi:MAG: hypothetical protein FJ267_18815 [Planctomycetes bacterium]|nr:hypothetical protein [Planctomycetota bacterium]
MTRFFAVDVDVEPAFTFLMKEASEKPDSGFQLQENRTMRTLTKITLMLLAITSLQPVDAADVVIRWNNILLDTIRATGGPPLPDLSCQRDDSYCHL